MNKYANAILLVTVIFDLLGCATPGQRNLNSLAECAIRRANELDDTCFVEHSDMGYEGIARKVSASFGHASVRVDLGRDYTINCENSDTKFFDIAKTLQPGQWVRVSGSHTSVSKGYSVEATLKDCQLAILSETPDQDSPEVSAQTEGGACSGSPRSCIRSTAKASWTR